MRSRRVALVAASALLLVAGAGGVVACSSDNPPPAGSSGTVSGDGGGEADTAPGLPNQNDKLCVGLDGGKVVAEIGRNQDPPPALGGTVMAGTYVLDELYAYGPIDSGTDAGEPVNEGLTGNSGTGTLVVGKGTLAFLQSYGPNANVGTPAAAGFAFTAEGTDISAAQVCPSTEATKVIKYSAVGDSLALFVEPKRRVVFRRQP